MNKNDTELFAMAVWLMEQKMATSASCYRDNAGQLGPKVCHTH